MSRAANHVPPLYTSRIIPLRRWPTPLHGYTRYLSSLYLSDVHYDSDVAEIRFQKTHAQSIVLTIASIHGYWFANKIFFGLQLVRNVICLVDRSDHFILSCWFCLVKVMEFTLYSFSFFSLENYYILLLYYIFLLHSLHYTGQSSKRN